MVPTERANVVEFSSASMTRGEKKGKIILGPCANTRSSMKRTNLKSIVTVHQIRSLNSMVAKLTISARSSPVLKMMQSSGVFTREMIYRAKGKAIVVDDSPPTIFEVGSTSSSMASNKKRGKSQGLQNPDYSLGKAKLDSDPQPPKFNKAKF